jgi:hypothetical protein
VLFPPLIFSMRATRSVHFILSVPTQRVEITITQKSFLQLTFDYNYLN